MSEGDFEPMIFGAIEEVRTLRNFVRQLNNIARTEEDRDNFVIEVTRELGKVNMFYAAHDGKYPSTL